MHPKSFNATLLILFIILLVATIQLKGVEATIESSASISSQNSSVAVVEDEIKKGGRWGGGGGGLLSSKANTLLNFRGSSGLMMFGLTVFGACVGW